MGLFDSLYKNNVSAPVRIYGESLLKAVKGTKDNPITLDDFSDKEKETLRKLVDHDYRERMKDFRRPKKELLDIAKEYEEDAAKIEQWRKNSPQEVWGQFASPERRRIEAKQYREAAEGKYPTDFAFQYHNYGLGDSAGFENTLGRFRYKIDPKTQAVQVYDSYDFSNPRRQPKVDAYEKMTPLDRFTSSLKAFFDGDRAALGEAYLGNKGVPVDLRFNLQYEDPFGDTTK